MALDNQRLVKKSLLKCDEEDTIKLENQMYSMCYLNQYIIARYPRGNNFIFILGCDWNITISQALDYSHVTMQSVMSALGHPVKVEIINELSKKDLTISQLARILQLARTSITRYIDDLLDELVIVKARKYGAEIYYHLNSTYLRYAKATFDNFLEQKIIDADKLL